MKEQEVILQQTQLPTRKKNYWLSRLGLLLACMPLFGVLLIVFAINSSFWETSSKSTDSLVSRVSASFELLLALNAIGLVGFLLLFWELLVSKNRELWFYSNAQTISIIMCIFGFPFWTIVGATLLICLRYHSKEFPQKGKLKSFKLH